MSAFNMSRIQFQQVIRMSAKHGVKLPKPVTEAHAKAERVSAAARTMGDPRQLGPAVLAALREERDPATDPEVQRLVTLTRVIENGIETYVDDALAAELRETFTRQADGIVKAWQTVVEQAAGDLEAARETLGDVALTDTAGVLERGGNAAQAWASATQANRVIDDARGVWNALGGFTGVPLDRNHNMLCLIADLDVAGYDALGLGDQQERDGWTLVRAGHRPRLATFGEYHERVQALIRGRQTKAAADTDYLHTGVKDSDHSRARDGAHAAG